MQNLAKMLQREPLVHRRRRQADPGNVTLANVLHTRSPIHKVVNLALQHRLKVLLHLPAGYLNHNAQVHCPLVRHAAKIRPHNLDLAVRHRVHIGHLQILKAARILAAKLHPHIHLAHHFTFKGGTVGHRHGHILHLDLNAADFNALLHQPFRTLQIIRALNLIEGHRDNMLIRRHAGG